jgi:hypothetical protein
MQLATHPPRGVLGVATLTALLAIHGASSSITIHSENGNRGFGMYFATHGSTIVTHDLSCHTGRRGGRVCWPVVRIGRIDDDRVVESERLVFQTLDSFAVAQDTIVVRRAEVFRKSGELHFFTKTDEGWRTSQPLALEPACVGENHGYDREVELGARTLVVNSDQAWCIYERSGATWRYTTSLRKARDQLQEIGVSRDRIVVLNLHSVDLYQGAEGQWRGTRIIKAPAEARFSKLAVSDRWLVTRGDGVLYVYDLDTAQLAATLRSQLDDDDEFATWFAASDTTIAATGKLDQAWGFIDHAWRPLGSLTGANDKSPPSWRRVHIGKLIWIGNPRSYPGPDGGSVHGFRR